MHPYTQFCLLLLTPRPALPRVHFEPDGMGKTEKKEAGNWVHYHGQRPRAQGKRPGPLYCFTVNLKNAIRRAFPALQHNDNENSKKSKTRIECLMDFLAFDVNQLLIYENQRKRCTKPEVIHDLRCMKTKIEELKIISSNNRCLWRAEEMLKRRSHLKCTSRSFRRELIEFMANVEATDKRSKIVSEIMKQLDATDMEIAALCKSVKDTSIALTCGIQTETDFAFAGKPIKDCGDVEDTRPPICKEVMRPYDPTTDEDAQSIHLRYVPALDSFKADMARNPCALRLPLMCPPMKRIMNKMKASYLMDDVPCDVKNAETSDPCCIPFVNYVQVVHSNDRKKRITEEHSDATRTKVTLNEENITRPTTSENLRKGMDGQGFKVYTMKYISKLSMVLHTKLTKEIYIPNNRPYASFFYCISTPLIMISCWISIHNF